MRRLRFSCNKLSAFARVFLRIAYLVCILHCRRSSSRLGGCLRFLVVKKTWPSLMETSALPVRSVNNRNATWGISVQPRVSTEVMLPSCYYQRNSRLRWFTRGGLKWMSIDIGCYEPRIDVDVHVGFVIVMLCIIDNRTLRQMINWSCITVTKRWR